MHHCLPTGLHNSCIIYFRIINKAQHPLYVMYSIFSWRSDCQDLFSRRHGEGNISQSSDKRYFTHHTDLKLFVFEYSEKNSQNPPMSGSPTPPILYLEVSSWNNIFCHMACFPCYSKQNKYSSRPPSPPPAHPPKASWCHGPTLCQAWRQILCSMSGDMCR